MHHISVHIINDTDSEDSCDEFGSFFDDDVRDHDVFMDMWSTVSKICATPEAPEDPESLNSIGDAYKHLKSALSDISALKTVLNSNVQKKGFAAYSVVEHPRTEHKVKEAFEIFRDRKIQLQESADLLLESASSLREEINRTRQYFREVDMLSQKFPLKLINQPNSNSHQIAIDTALQTSASILLRESNDTVEWGLSVDSCFSFNNKSFEIDTTSNYLRYFFELMCHQLFERIKDDHIKSSIHYSADKQTRSVHFDVGNKETWLFEIGLPKEPGEIPVWVPKLIRIISDPSAQPASYMRQLLYYRTTLRSMIASLCGRFLCHDFCTMTSKSRRHAAAFQISSPALQIPYLAFIDRSRVSMTETPNEMRCIPYSTDGRGLTPALEKWCDSAFSALFLAMAERTTRSYGFVFKNKNLYGTATNGGRKIKFRPLQNGDVEILVSAHATSKMMWRNVPGSDFNERMSVILFTDF